MKKWLSFLLIALMMISTAACSSSPEAEAPVAGDSEELTATISVQVEADWLAYYEEAKARVLATYPDATIEFIETPSFDHLDVLDQTNVTNEDVADVFALPADRIYGLAQNDALTPIDAQAMAANVGGFSDYDGGLGGNFNVDGDYLAFPMNIETLINFANRANAESAGLDLSSPMEFTEMDYETMLIPVFNAWFGVAVTNAADIEFLAKADDGTLSSDLTNDWGDLPAEKQAVFEALFNYYKAHAEANTSLWDNTAAWGYMDTAFTTGGPTAVRLEGPWSTGSLSNLAGEGADLDILPIGQVTVNGQPMAHWQGGWGLGVNARVEGNDDQLLLAQTFIEEVVNTDYAIDFFKATGKILENVDASVYLESDLSDIDKEIIGAVVESYENAPARPLFTEWGSVWTTWENAVLSWAAVKPATAEEAYAEIQAAFEAMMLNF